jgi:cellulose synthase (UDP-forming)
MTDCRLGEPTWNAGDPGRAQRARATLLALASTVALALYFGWLLQPGRVGNPALFALLIVAELFNVAQAAGFWWTCLATRRRRPSGSGRIAMPDVDVFIPTYSEPVEVVEATVVAATQMHGARVHVALLDDGNRTEMVELAQRHGIRYVRRTLHEGAKAGNINHALGRTHAPYVVVLDCDHVPHPDLLIKTLPEFADATVAFVQTPQYYANAASGRVAAAAWSQQSLFFGPIARGKDAHDAMFCCGTNVLFRRSALEVVGGFPSGSLTEDFAISLELHERGWRSVYIPDVLASGLGPEDLASYVSQQHRWARGCIGMIPRVLAADLGLRHKIQYLLSASYFLTGWTVLVYLSLPVIRILTGAQPVAGAAADSFLAAFGPYFALSLATVASVGAGHYTFAAYSLATSTFWIHVHATYRTLRRRAGSFVVTPKQGATGRQLAPAAPTLVVIAILVAVAVYGLFQGRDAATLNNVALATVHVAILGHGVAAAVAPSLAAATATSVAPIDDTDDVAA